MTLSETEKEAIRLLKRKSFWVSEIHEKNYRGIFNEIIPGMSVFKKLEKKDLVIFVHDEDEDFSDYVELSDEGWKIARTL